MMASEETLKKLKIVTSEYIKKFGKGSIPNSKILSQARQKMDDKSVKGFILTLESAIKNNKKMP